MSLNSVPWKTESNLTTQIGVCVLGMIVSLALLWGFRDFDSSGLTNSLAGFLLGLLIFVICVIVLVQNEKQTITVDPKARRIVVEKNSRFKNQQFSLAFDDIDSVYVSNLGSESSRMKNYFVVARLKNGKTVNLFFGFFDGSYNRGAVEARCRRLEGYLKL